MEIILGSKAYLDKDILEYMYQLRQKGTSWNGITTQCNNKYKKKLSRETYRFDYRKSEFYTQENIHPYEHFTKESLGRIPKKFNEKNGVYIITSATPAILREGEHGRMIGKSTMKDGFKLSSNLNKPFFNAMLNFQKYCNAELLILPMRAHMPPLNKQPNHYDPDLLQYKDNFTTDAIITPNLKLS